MAFYAQNRQASAGSIAKTTLFTNGPAAALNWLRAYVSTDAGPDPYKDCFVAVTFIWTDGGQIKTFSTPTVSLHLAQNQPFSMMYPIFVDANAAISYAVAVSGTTGAYTIALDGGSSSN